MVRNHVENRFDLRMQERIPLTVQFHFHDKRKNRLCNRTKRAQLHVPAKHACFIESFLAAADLATQIAFIGEREVAEAGRRDLGATAAQEITGLFMVSPEE